MAFDWQSYIPFYHAERAQFHPERSLLGIAVAGDGIILLSRLLSSATELIGYMPVLTPVAAVVAGATLLQTKQAAGKRTHLERLLETKSLKQKLKERGLDLDAIIQGAEKIEGSSLTTIKGEGYTIVYHTNGHTLIQKNSARTANDSGRVIMGGLVQRYAYHNVHVEGIDVPEVIDFHPDFGNVTMFVRNAAPLETRVEQKGEEERISIAKRVLEYMVALNDELASKKGERKKDLFARIPDTTGTSAVYADNRKYNQLDVFPKVIGSRPKITGMGRELDAEYAAAIEEAMQPYQHHLCHGDLNLGNILENHTADGERAGLHLIDWEAAKRSHLYEDADKLIKRLGLSEEGRHQVEVYLQEQLAQRGEPEGQVERVKRMLQFHSDINETTRFTRLALDAQTEEVRIRRLEYAQFFYARAMQASTQLEQESEKFRTVIPKLRSLFGKVYHENPDPVRMREIEERYHPDFHCSEFRERAAEVNVDELRENAIAAHEKRMSHYHHRHFYNRAMAIAWSTVVSAPIVVVSALEMFYNPGNESIAEQMRAVLPAIAITNAVAAIPIISMIGIRNIQNYRQEREYDKLVTP